MNEDPATEMKEPEPAQAAPEAAAEPAGETPAPPAAEPAAESAEAASAEPEAAPANPEAAPANPEAASAGPEAGVESAEHRSAEADAAKAEAEKAKAEAAALKDRLLRLQADFDNFRKRQARDRAEWIQQSNADLLEELLPVLDQTDAAIASVSKDSSEAAKPFRDGFELVRRTFLNAVGKFGLKPVEGVVGKPLDTATSEAITIMRTGQTEPGCVVYETRRGYVLNGKVLRAAQVVVEDEAEAPAPAAEPAPAEAEAPAAEPAGNQEA
jgi:molecular chaperone GrpE